MHSAPATHPSHQPDAADLWREAGRGFARLFHASAAFSWFQSSTACLALSGVACPDLNCGVIDTGPAIAEDVLTMTTQLREHHVPGLLLITDAAGPDARAVAESVGLVSVGRMPLMVMKAQQLKPPSRQFSLRRVVDGADLLAAIHVMATAFDLSAEMVDQVFTEALLAARDIDTALVLDGDHPVGAIQATTTAGVTGIWSMATLPEHRRRGIARAALTEVLNQHFAKGSHTAFLIATQAGRPLYDAFGFEVIDWCEVWLCQND